MARRENTQSRRGRERALRPGHVLVVCGGQRTEPDYFKGLARARGARLKVKSKVDSPENLVRYAAAVFTPDEYEGVWCVVDADEFDIDTARVAAARAEVGLAVSEPCFELWLLLHFADHRAHIANGKAACALLAKHVPGYAKKLDYPVFDAGVETAVERAEALGEGNPATGVWRLVKAVLKPEFKP
ncbi:RloB domain-containing protein [Lentzea sp. CC55]|uniref:RloB family protein n=1 Tax=Lentzea sp. CC55 TaxID=2884909 RepID=UPI0027E0E512|nr:RloB domain-containing protein [Lentzea sp. CC55]MCG8922926.1 RloB family protein [Lentzea sp. CC55]